jgi:hypothetical protein
MYPCATVRTTNSDRGIFAISLSALRPFCGIAVVLAAALLLSACSVLGEKTVYRCPAVSILQDAQKITRFKSGAGRDITDIRFQAEIVNFTGACEYDEDDDKWEAEIELLIQIAVKRGPANKDGKIDFRYFAAIPEFQSQERGKSIFSVAGQFEGNRTRLIYQDELSMRIPVAKPTDGQGLAIVLGFQLSPNELTYNRESKGR